MEIKDERVISVCEWPNRECDVIIIVEKALFAWLNYLSLKALIPSFNELCTSNTVSIEIILMPFVLIYRTQLTVLIWIIPNMWMN